ncbi:MAG: hypothetical protein AB7O37_02140 [Vicinamibacteria bacterium]
MKRHRGRLELGSAELQLHHDATAFLGRFEPAALEAELRAAGVHQGLARRGFVEPVLQTELEGGEHRLKLLPRGAELPLVDLRLAEASAVVDEPFLVRRGLDVVSFLCIHWLALQDPTAAFTPERPQLPGQSHPGLGLARPLILRLLKWATDWGKDGLLNLPEYFHNAVFYSEIFRFLHPRQQGRFEALRRDLAGLHVAAASFAIDAGRVVSEPAGEPLRWEPGEMVAPLTGRLRRAFDSDDYAAAVGEAKHAARFRLLEPVARASGGQLDRGEP